MKALPILFFLIFVLVISAQAQNIFHKPNVYSLGIGLGSRIFWNRISDDKSLQSATSANIYAQVDNKKYYLKTGLLHLHENEPLLGPKFNVDEEVNSFYVLGGLNFMKKNAFANVGAGLALNHGIYRGKHNYDGNYESAVYNNIGLPIEVVMGTNLKEKAKKGICRLAITLHGEISKYSYLAWNIGLSFGIKNRLKSK